MSSPSDLPIPTEDDAALVETLAGHRRKGSFFQLATNEDVDRLLAVAAWAVEAARKARMDQAGVVRLDQASYEIGVRDALANPEAARLALKGSGS